MAITLEAIAMPENFEAAAKRRDLMKLVPIDPPGMFCTYEALRDLLRRVQPKRFIDVGCGNGNISKLFCSLGMNGVGLDFSKLALQTTSRTLRTEIDAGAYRVVEADATDLRFDIEPADVAVSVMVMEHVHDDIGFVRKLSTLVRPQGHLVLCVPGRKDCWSFEDETVGHLRRYDRDDLRSVLEAGGLKDVEVWSVAVPIANLLLLVGARLVRNSGEVKKVALSQREQTETSGVRDIPWKTMFPWWCKVILNRYTLYPLFVLQRMFYRTGLGVTMLGFGRVVAAESPAAAREPRERQKK